MGPLLAFVGGCQTVLGFETFDSAPGGGGAAGAGGGGIVDAGGANGAAGGAGGGAGGAGGAQAGEGGASGEGGGANVVTVEGVLFAGDNHTYALHATQGAAWGWGLNDRQQVLPHPTEKQYERLHLEPVALAPPAPPQPLAVGRFGLGTAHSCALGAETQGLLCWGSNAGGQLGLQPQPDPPQSPPPPAPYVTVNLAGAQRLALGAGHTCAVAAGAVQCWGANNAGQLSRPAAATEPLHAPAPVRDQGGAPLQGATDLATRAAHSCAVVAGGVRCWGANGSKQSGEGGEPVRAQAVRRAPSEPLDQIERVATGTTHSCAVATNGRVFCWGANDVGQLGRSSPGAPDGFAALVKQSDGGDLRRVKQLALGKDFACALNERGFVLCWGHNNFGVLGRPNAPPPASQPDVSPEARPVNDEQGNGLLRDVRQIVAGAFHVCALLGDGRVLCWGRNDAGQLGRGGFDGNDHPLPAPVGGELPPLPVVPPAP